MKTDQTIERYEEDEKTGIAEPLDSSHDNTDAESMIEQFTMAVGQMMPQNDIARKLSPEHITKMLETDELEIKEAAKSEHENKIMYLLIFFGILLFLGFVIVFLKDSAELMEKIITGLFGFFAGALSGYGVGKSKSNKN